MALFKIWNRQNGVHPLVWRPRWKLGIYALKTEYPGWGRGRIAGRGLLEVMYLQTPPEWDQTVSRCRLWEAGLYGVLPPQPPLPAAVLFGSSRNL